jgi:hypothetical protein
LPRAILTSEENAREKKMNSKEEVELLEKLIGQLQGLHDEITTLAKKSPNDGLNAFKLRLVNKVLANSNLLLKGRYRPFDDFDQFDSDALPSNSDATMILAQYMEQIERLRSDNVEKNANYDWCYIIKGRVSDIPSKAPTRVGTDRK